MKVIPPSQLRSTRTQQKILAATEQLLATRAFDQISVAMITTKAGISVGNFYNRFPEKSALLVLVYQQYLDERGELLASLIEEDDLQLAEVVSKLTGQLVELISERRFLIRSYIMHVRLHPDAADTEMKVNLESVTDDIADLLFRRAKQQGIKTTRRRTSTAAQVIGALCREFILFADEPAKASLNLTKNELKEHIIIAALAILTGAV